MPSADVGIYISIRAYVGFEGLSLTLIDVEGFQKVLVKFTKRFFPTKITKFKVVNLSRLRFIISDLVHFSFSPQRAEDISYIFL